MIQRTFLRPIQAVTRQPQSLRIAPTATSRSSPVVSGITPPASQRLGSRRWYAQAQEAEAKKEGGPAVESHGNASGTQPAAADASKADPSQAELESKKREVIDLTDRLKRSVADYRNLQEQTKREIQASRDFALQRFAKDLLDSIDNLDRALSNVEPSKLDAADANPDLKNLHSGLRMTEQILMGTLKRHGMERFDPAETAEKFDPNRMEATFQAPQQGKEDGTVFYTQSKGYTLNGRVLRAAKVGVVKNS
ncbi:hypothetical protein BAUCODRAFT_34164 [Baudoinia panamericana UAMH 10762]|uniref:GrpE protein homolog n=1 Tax=Baudoinia panamericana (strain UAMH 10762) TaxID=717646 RepID=M2NC66_BAUPA|nr:uncharacterized protein BAUCODRAFT_34164 [Baudoinia panamericana UAMH 10762]EMC96769.1 hypothetical protein BAUCODRAFT_34164 [Baudoinia panamericana UAMH 10762]